MKKIFIFILCLITCLMLDVQASSKLNMEFQENIYYVRRGGGEYSSNILSFYTIDDKVVYCVEPGVLVTDFNYQEEIGLDNLNLSLETKELIGLIGYYGYEYPGHTTTRFRMATQALIWEVSTNHIVEFYTERYGYGNYIDVSYEKNIIMDLVNSHHIKPTFDGDTFNGYYNMTIASSDANNVLDSYEVLDDGGNSVKIKNNEITINPLKVGKSKIILKKKKYDNNPSILYIPSNGTSQKVAHLRVDIDELATINLNIQGAKVEVLKKDSDTLNNPIGDNKLGGAIFGIYDEDNNLIDKIETDNEGKVSKYLALGNYKLKEIEPSYGYLLNYKTYEFSLTKTDLVSEIKVYEEAIKKDITIKKVMDNETGILDYEPNITFDIYLKSTNKLIASKTTDQNGYLNIRLPYGIYIFKQRNTTEGYLKANDFEIEINENTKNIVQKVVVNKKIASKVKVQKVDRDTGENINLSGIKFKIKNLDTNQYVCQEVTYPNLKTICEFETGSDGSFTTPKGLFGNYQVEEVEQVIPGYNLNKQPIKFTISNKTEFQKNEFNDNIIVINFPNERIKGNLKINKLGEEVIIEDKITYNKIPLLGVKFNLYAKENIYLGNKLVFKKDELIDTLITNQEGIVSLDNLYQGSYYLKEIESDNNNLISNQLYYFDIPKNDQVVLNIENYLPKGSIELNKIDSITKEGISNTLIAIYKEDKLIYKGKTDKEGKITLTNLPIGTYSIKEIESNPDYIKSDSILEFTISEDQEIINLSLENEKIITGSIKINKRGEELVINKGITYNKVPLHGVKFNLYAKDDIYLGNKLIHEKDKLIETLITNEDGVASLDNLYLGSYYIEEMESSNGNLVNKERYYFDLTYKDQDTDILEIINLENYLPKGSIELNKIDSITKEGISNTLIAIYKKDKLIYEGKTDTNGKLNLTNLPIGTYSIKEIESNPDYIKSDSILEFTISEDQEIINLSLENEKIVQVIEVPNTSKDKIDKLNVMSFILMITGISLIFYVFKINGAECETEYVK